MSEEVRDASKAVPRAMISIWLVNSFLAFTSFVTVAYHLPNLDEALADPTLYPIIHVLRQSMSKEWLTVILTFILFLLICSNMTYLAAVTRDIWAFARDQGFPFSSWISKVDKKRHIPRNAITITSATSVCLSLIYIGSPVAFYAMTSLVTVALLQCYCLSIGCILWRRIAYPETLPPATFSLGKFGIPVNIAAVCYALWGFFWAFWPTYHPVIPETFNWASVLFTATLIGAGIHFVFVARRKYFGPVANVQGRKVQPRWTRGDLNP
jgi:choline transport protein